MKSYTSYRFKRYPIPEYSNTCFTRFCFFRISKLFLTLIGRKSRLARLWLWCPSPKATQGEAVVAYREPSATKGMAFHRLSLWVNKMMKKTSDDNPSMSVLSQPINSSVRPCIFEVLIFLLVLFTIL